MLLGEKEGKQCREGKVVLAEPLAKSRKSRKRVHMQILEKKLIEDVPSIC